MKSPEYIAEAKAYLSSMSEHDLDDAGDEFQRLFGYAMELSLALTAGERLAAFGAAVLEESRDDLCDLDGGWLQEKAVELGVLVEVPVTEACDESTCRCAEYGFPTTCYRYAPEVCAAMEKANG